MIDLLNWKSSSPKIPEMTLWPPGAWPPDKTTPIFNFWIGGCTASEPPLGTSIADGCPNTFGNSFAISSAETRKIKASWNGWWEQLKIEMKWERRVKEEDQGCRRRSFGDRRQSWKGFSERREEEGRGRCDCSGRRCRRKRIGRWQNEEEPPCLRRIQRLLRKPTPFFLWKGKTVCHYDFLWEWSV